jgi:hypothetical protein
MDLCSHCRIPYWLTSILYWGALGLDPSGAMGALDCCDLNIFGPLGSAQMVIAALLIDA